MLTSFLLFRSLGQPESDGKRVTGTTPNVEQKKPTVPTQGKPHAQRDTEPTMDWPREARRGDNIKKKMSQHANAIGTLGSPRSARTLDNNGKRISHGNDPLMRHAKTRSRRESNCHRPIYPVQFRRSRFRKDGRHSRNCNKRGQYTP